jgi:hypothetical protein
LWNYSILVTQHAHDKHIIDVVIDAFVREQETKSRLWVNNLQKGVIVNEEKDGTSTHDVCLDALPREGSKRPTSTQGRYSFQK